MRGSKAPVALTSAIAIAPSSHVERCTPRHCNLSIAGLCPSSVCERITFAVNDCYLGLLTTRVDRGTAFSVSRIILLVFAGRCTESILEKRQAPSIRIMRRRQASPVKGSFHAGQMIAYGTKVVAGVTPGKGGTEHQGVPIFGTVADAVRKPVQTRP
jgi:hypothetical protein